MALIEAIRKTQAQRTTSTRDLREILPRGGEAGKEIHNLCDQYGRTTRPEIERAVTGPCGRRTPGSAAGRRSR